MANLLAGKIKSGKTVELFGCDPRWFITKWAPRLLRAASKKHGIEMTLENYGAVWVWDHLKPLASFNLADPEQQRYAFCWRNLRPLPKAANLTKGAKEPALTDVCIAMPAVVPGGPADIVCPVVTTDRCDFVHTTSNDRLVIPAERVDFEVGGEKLEVETFDPFWPWP